MLIDPSDENFEPTRRYLVEIMGTGFFHVNSFEELVADLRPYYAEVAPLNPDGATEKGRAAAAASNSDPTEELPPVLEDPHAAEIEAEIEDAMEIERQCILGELALDFIQMFEVQQVAQAGFGFDFDFDFGKVKASAAGEGADTGVLPAPPAATQSSSPPQIRLVSGMEYQPYTDMPLPPSDGTTLVISYQNLDEILDQLRLVAASSTSPMPSASVSQPAPLELKARLPLNSAIGAGAEGWVATLTTVKHYLLVIPLHDARLFFQLLNLTGLVQIYDLTHELPQQTGNSDN